MKFRKIHWVVERLGEGTASQIAGVFTSNQDLAEKVIGRIDGRLRLSLVQLDSDQGPLGSWEIPNFGSLLDDLRLYVDDGEMSENGYKMLVDALGVGASAQT